MRGDQEVTSTSGTQQKSEQHAAADASSLSQAAIPLPLIKGWPLVGNLPAWRQDTIGFLSHHFRQHPRAFRFQVANYTFLFCGHPDVADRVLRANARNYTKSQAYQKVGPLLGNGLLLSEGDLWRRQRRLMQTAFHEPAIVRSLDVIEDSANHMRLRLESFAAKGEAFDVNALLSGFALEVITRMIFGSDVQEADVQKVYQSLNAILPIIFRRIYSWLPIPNHWPTPANLKIRSAIQQLDEIVHRYIEEARKDQESLSKTLLGRMVAAKDEAGAPMSNQQIRDEVMTLFLAGHETTATALTWAMVLLTSDGKIAAQLSDAVASYSDFHIENDYLESVIYETLRIYPPAWAFGRQAREDDQVGNVTISSKDLCFISPYFIHRHPDFWPDAERFLPERFAQSERRHKFETCYVPFASGLRSCIGKHLALLEMRVALTAMVRDFSWVRASQESIQLQPKIVLKPKGAVMMRVNKR